MHKRLLVTRLLILAFTSATHLAAADAANTDWTELRDVIRAEMAEAKIPGAATAVVSGDRVLFAEGFGVADLTTGTAVTPQTRFRIGSLTKLLTATAIVSTAMTPDAKLALDVPLRTYVSDLPPRFQTLTLDRLLTHRAGLIDRVSDHKPRDGDFFTAPDRIFSYSSLGYSIAGHAAATATGKSFEAFLTDAVLKRLGLDATSYTESPSLMARGYRLRGTKISPAPLMENINLRPAGLLYSNVEDLAHFAIAFMNGGVRPDVAAAVSRPRVDIPGEERRYGYGAFLTEERGFAVVSHGGDEPGGSSLLKMVPQKNVAVVMLTNLKGRLPRSMAVALRAAAGIEPAEETKDAWTPLAPTDIEELVGNYGVFLVKKKGNSIALTPKLPWFVAWMDVSREIVKFGPDRFGYIRNESGAEARNLVAVRGADGRIEYIFIGGRAFRRHEGPRGSRQ